MTDSISQNSEQSGLLDRVELIEGQPLEQRAHSYDQVAAELLADLQQSDTHVREL